MVSKAIVVTGILLLTILLITGCTGSRPSNAAQNRIQNEISNRSGGLDENRILNDLISDNQTGNLSAQEKIQKYLLRQEDIPELIFIGTANATSGIILLSAEAEAYSTFRYLVVESTLRQTISVYNSEDAAKAEFREYVSFYNYNGLGRMIDMGDEALISNFYNYQSQVFFRDGNIIQNIKIWVPFYLNKTITEKENSDVIRYAQIAHDKFILEKD